MLHVSTDFVFGEGRGRPRLPSDRPEPLGVYGASKLAGEELVAEATAGEALIMRSAWVYSRHGRNFVTAILERIRLGDALGVVADQVGTPTWARGLAQALWRGLALGLGGIHHWTDAGVASWYDFAVAIQDDAVDLGLLERPVEIQPLRSEDYETAAARPAFSVLDKTATWKALGLKPNAWRHALRVMLGEFRELENARPTA
jgi:dTDP-4-dehydrorhamnose reductase